MKMATRKRRDVTDSELKIEQSQTPEVVRSVSKTRLYETKWLRCAIIIVCQIITHKKFIPLGFLEDIKSNYPFIGCCQTRTNIK